MRERNVSNMDILLWNRSHEVLDMLITQATMYNLTASVILTILYIPVFIVALVGNITALAVLVRTVWKKYLMKTAFIINLVVADLSGSIFSSCCH